MRRSAQSVGQKTKLPESPAPVIDEDDWTNDWRTVARGLQFSDHADTYRCLYCKNDITVLPSQSPWGDGKAHVYSWTQNPETIPQDRLFRWIRHDHRLVREAAINKCPCPREGCITIWSMSVDV